MPSRKIGRTSSLFARFRRLLAGVTLVGLLSVGCGGPAPGGAGSPKPAGPERLFLFGRKGVAEMDLAGGKPGEPIATKGGAPAIVIPNADRSLFYMVTGRRELIEVFDVKQNKVLEVFSLSKPKGPPIVRAMIFGLAPSPDDKTLWLYVMPSVREQESLRLDESYLVEVDRASGTRRRELKCPPGITNLTFLQDGHTLFLYGRDVYAVDTAEKQLKLTTELAVRNPNVQGESETDIVAEWPHFRESGRWISLPYAQLDQASQRWFLGMLVTDLQTGEIDKIEAGPPPDNMVAFSSIVSPNGEKGYCIFSQLLTMDLKKRQAEKYVTLPRSYSILTITKDGKKIYASGSGASVLEYDTEAAKVVREVDVPYEVTELGMSDQ